MSQNLSSEAEAGDPRRRQDVPEGWSAQSGFVTSLVVHLVAIIVLGMFTIGREHDDGTGTIISALEPSEPFDELQQVEPGRASRVEDDTAAAPGPMAIAMSVESPALPAPAASLPANPLPKQATFGFLSAEAADWMTPLATVVHGGFEGRRGEERLTLLRERGGTRQSEAAVTRGLRWLAAHQRDDGSWRFDHTKGLCQGQCRNPGAEASTTASTALALLAMLGAGQTHHEGEYQDQVRRGLYYLSTRAAVSDHGADLQDGTMYAQGLATLALCEAYGMTHDQALKDLAQQAVNFILYAQDRGGGWRYSPGSPGDTTVTGWQFMALKSAMMAGLEVSSPSLALADRFLDSVQTDSGAQYRYMPRELKPRASTTAIGLLCRMYLGWRREHPALKRGVEHLSHWGPSDEELYYDYYATQVLCQYGGPAWDKWNRALREHLIATQASQGHESGSWYFRGDPGAASGGRLYCTALAVMTLEVYYRYLPLYSSASVDKAFNDGP